MKIIRFTFLFFSIGLLSVTGQVSIGSWTDHFSWKNVTKIVSHNNYVYGATTSGVIVYDKNENLLSKLSKVNGLSDMQVSSIAVDNRGTLVIGYVNGNIDIIENGKVINMRDLLIKNMQQSKKINEISIYDDEAYLSCDFGILIINLVKHEVADNYILSSTSQANPVNNSIVVNDTIYAATVNGVYSSSLNNSRIQIFSSWKQVTLDSQEYCDLAYFNKGLFLAKGAKDAQCILQLQKDGLTTDLTTFSKFRQISAFETLVITDRGTLTVLDSNYVVIKILGAYTQPFLSATQLTDGYYYIGKNNTGIRKFANLIEDDSQYYDYLPNGPYSNIIFEVKSSSSGVWITPGGLTNDWNNLFIEPYYSFYNGSNWESFDKYSFPEFSNEWDLLRVAVNPKNPSNISICTWGSGVYEINNNKSIVHYDQHNSILKNIFPQDNNYVRVGGIAIDKNGATWMPNAEINLGGLVVKSEDNKWYTYDYLITSKKHSQGQICVTKNNFKWSFFPPINSPQSGIFVWDDNGTIEDSSDDRYRGPVNRTTDMRNVGELRLWNSSKEVITNKVNCFAEDKSGALWIGTEKGPLVYYRPSAIFDEEFPIATQINLPRNDGSGLGDYLLGEEIITSIAIDDANRKWFGTSTSGVYLISADGTLQIDHFTVDNSPLPSNTVISLNYEEKTGQIFIGTSQGLVSYKGTAVNSSEDNNSPYVYPNPVHPGYSGLITVKGIMTDSNVKITDVSGNIVNELKSLGGQAVWDGNNFNGERVSSGVYYFLITNSDGSESGKTKVLIVN